MLYARQHPMPIAPALATIFLPKMASVEHRTKGKVLPKEYINPFIPPLTLPSMLGKGFFVSKSKNGFYFVL